MIGSEAGSFVCAKPQEAWDRKLLEKLLANIGGGFQFYHLHVLKIRIYFV